MFLLADINECLNVSANNCSEPNNEVCRNVEGSYTCDCSPGYQRYQEGELYICRGIIAICTLNPNKLLP